MATIMDQYEEAASGTVPKARKTQEPIAGGFINATIDEEYPIFNKQKISFSPKDPLTHLSVNNSFLVMAQSSNILVRIDLEHPENKSDIELPKAVDDRIYQLFVDPTGQHIIVSMTSSENYYMTRNAKKVRNLTKFKGHQISSIAWNRANSTETATGKILIGTSKGMIFETEILDSEDGRFFQSSIDQYASPMYKLAKEKPYPVTGLQFERMKSSNPTEYKFFVIATLPGRLYQFIGNIPASAEAPIFQHIFSEYQNVPDRFLELPGNFGYSELRFYYPNGLTGPPSHFAWMTGPGVYYGEIEISGVQEQSVLSNTKLIQYPCENDEKRRNPKSIVLTEFHVLILFPSRIKAICLLNDQLMYDDIISEQKFGNMISMCKDSSPKGSIWSFAPKFVFKYKIIKEARDVWRMYLDKNDFAKAKLYSRDSPADANTVLTKEAQHYYSNKKYIESAGIYAQTQNSFEEITLKFIDLPDKDALKTFLQQKLLALSPQDKTQHTMIVTWLTEIYLNQLGSLREQGQAKLEEYNSMQEKFHKFLAHGKVRECVQNNKNTIYDLIASHGDVENMVFFAVFIQDIERVLTHHIQHENYKSALEVLTKQRNIELFYTFSPILMQNIPVQTVDAWIRFGSDLEAKKLIPALVQCNSRQGKQWSNEAIRYLEHCVQNLNVTDQAIHNYLLALYVKVKPEHLMTYLNMQGQEATQVNYDLKYALRLCSEHNIDRACVHIYSTMELYEEAVELALKVDVDLAKQHADKPENNEELQRKLWLRIARHVVSEKQDVKRAMEFLHECDLLKIEDILPFFPDFVTIDHFKDAICQSLQEYNEHIEGLKTDMEEATDSAREIRMEIHTFRNKYSFVNAQDRCYSCGFALMTRGFYLFPCQHSFHKDCLLKEVMPQLSKGNRRKVDLLLSMMSKDATQSANASSTVSIGRPDQSPKEKIDDIIASECLYCGDLMIRNIDKPFIDDDDYEDVMKSWL